MTHRPAATAAPTAQTQATFNRGDFVLYRDPAAYWSGAEDHTYVCRVDYDPIAYRAGGFRLVTLDGEPAVECADRRYMRLLPAVECMRDVDTASLDDPAGLESGAVAYLASLARKRAAQTTA